MKEKEFQAYQIVDIFLNNVTSNLQSGQLRREKWAGNFLSESGYLKKREVSKIWLKDHWIEQDTFDSFDGGDPINALVGSIEINSLEKNLDYSEELIFTIGKNLVVKSGEFFAIKAKISLIYNREGVANITANELDCYYGKNMLGMFVRRDLLFSKPLSKLDNSISIITNSSEEWRFLKKLEYLH